MKENKRCLLLLKMICLKDSRAEIQTWIFTKPTHNNASKLFFLYSDNENIEWNVSLSFTTLFPLLYYGILREWQW